MSLTGSLTKQVSLQSERGHTSFVAVSFMKGMAVCSAAEGWRTELETIGLGELAQETGTGNQCVQGVCAARSR
jgi:hypothetical protein